MWRLSPLHCNTAQHCLCTLAWGNRSFLFSISPEHWERRLSSGWGEWRMTVLEWGKWSVGDQTLFRVVFISLQFECGFSNRLAVKKTGSCWQSKSIQSIISRSHSAIHSGSHSFAFSFSVNVILHSINCWLSICWNSKRNFPACLLSNCRCSDKYFQAAILIYRKWQRLASDDFLQKKRDFIEMSRYCPTIFVDLAWLDFLLECRENAPPLSHILSCFWEDSLNNAKRALVHCTTSDLIIFISRSK